MRNGLLVGTRKGLFRVEQDSAGRWGISQHWFPGDPVSVVLPESGDRPIHAALDRQDAALVGRGRELG